MGNRANLISIPEPLRVALDTPASSLAHCLCQMLILIQATAPRICAKNTGGQARDGSLPVFRTRHPKLCGFHS